MTRHHPGPDKPPRGPTLLALLLLILSCATALGQAKPRRDATIADVQFGWQNAVVHERWNPIRVHIAGGERGFSGVLVAEFNQDATQAARIITPAAATPGLTTPVDLAAAMPGLIDRVEFTLISDTGFEVHRVTYDHIPGPRESQLSFNAVFDQGLLLALGPLSVTSAIESVTTPAPPATGANAGVEFEDEEEFGPPAPENLPRNRWESLRLARAEPGSLPFLWTAYDGLQAIIIRTESFAETDSRAIDAVRAWVESGGRLILIVDGPGSRWRRWLPDGEAGELVQVSEVRPAKLPGPTGNSWPDDAGDPATSAQARRVELTERGRAEGWMTDWSTDDASAEALMARGPVGFGMVTILGLEPQSCLSQLSTPGLKAVWRDVLEGPLEGWLAGPPDLERGLMQYMGSMSGATPGSRQALMELLQRLTDVAPLGVGVVGSILAGMLLLTLLVGPVDALVLRRLKLRQHSWLTALGWISLMSIIAYLLPPLIRTGPDVIHRLEVRDLIVEPDAPPGMGRAWSAGLTGVFASQAGPIDLGPFGPGRWWRGVSAAYGESGGRRLLPPLPLRIDTGGPGGQEIRGAAPAGLTQTQWTLRCLSDDGPARADLSARVRREGDEWSVTLLGVPAAARLAQARLEVGDDEASIQWQSVSGPSAAGGLRVWRGRTMREAEGKLPPEFMDEGALPPGDDVPVILEMGAATTSEGAAAFERRPGRADALHTEVLDVETVLGVQDSADRTESIEARLASGRWARLTVMIAGLPPEFPGEPAARQSRTALYRILIPVPDGPGRENPE